MFDEPYIKKKLTTMLQDLELYSKNPADLARQLVRYARIVDEKAAIDECRYAENEIRGRILLDDPDYCSHSYMRNGGCPECGEVLK